MPFLDADFLAELQQVAVDGMAAQVKLFRIAKSQDASGSEVDTWPGMLGQPDGAPYLVLPAKVQADERIPYSNAGGSSKRSIALWIVKLPVIYNGIPVVVSETDRLETTDTITGVLLQLNIFNVYQGRSEQTTIDLFCERIP